MKYSTTIIAALGAAALSACTAPADKDKAAAGDTPAGTAAAADPAVADQKVAKPSPSDNLMKISCADFLATAEVAVDESDPDASKAAQDELANGLTWLHGYLYAKNNGEVAVLSQDWMKETVTKVHASCKAAKDAAKVSLFEVATS